MHKSLVLGILVCAVGAPARPAAAQLTSIGVMAGPVFADFRGSNSGGFNSYTGFMAGGWVNLDIGSVVGLRPEAFFVRKGADTNTSPSATFKIDYVEFPLLFTLGVPTAGLVGIQLYAGPQISFLSRCRADGTSAGDGALCTPAGFPVQSTDYGVIGGADLEIGSFVLGARYDLGLRQLDPDPNRDLKNQAFTVTGGFLFHLR